VKSVTYRERERDDTETSERVRYQRYQRECGIRDVTLSDVSVSSLSLSLYVTLLIHFIYAVSG